MTVLTPGIYADVPEHVYHDDPSPPSLSSSIAKVLIGRSPAHAWAVHPRLNPSFKREVSEKFDIGTAAHALLLEQEDRIEVLDFNDWRKAEARELRDQAREHGYIPLLPPQAEAAREMVDSARLQLAAHSADPKPFTNGEPEATIVWEDQQYVICRARIDWIHKQHGIIDDYKTTGASADPNAWVKTAYGIGADMQVAFYRRGIENLTGVKPDFRFVVQETYPPYALSVVDLSPAALAYAEEKVQQAIEKWARCLETNEWPAYDRRVASLEIPTWAEYQWLDKREETT